MTHADYHREQGIGPDIRRDVCDTCANIGMDTVTASLLELDEAEAALALVEATLANTNHYADRSRPATDKALEQLREDLEGRRAYWAEVEDEVEAAADEADLWEQNPWD